jgi:hypothetical protein
MVKIVKMIKRVDQPAPCALLPFLKPALCALLPFLKLALCSPSLRVMRVKRVKRGKRVK